MSMHQLKAKAILINRKNPLSYEDLGEALGIPAISAGQVLKALAKRGFHKITKLVVYKDEL